jgi:hypothetical protein
MPIAGVSFILNTQMIFKVALLAVIILSSTAYTMDMYGGGGQQPMMNEGYGGDSPADVGGAQADYGDHQQQHDYGGAQAADFQGQQYGDAGGAQAAEYGSGPDERNQY